MMPVSGVSIFNRPSDGRVEEGIVYCEDLGEEGKT